MNAKLCQKSDKYFIYFGVTLEQAAVNCLSRPSGVEVRREVGRNADFVQPSGVK